MSLIRSGVESHYRALLAAAGEPVVYRRRLDNTTYDLVMVPGQTDLSEYDLEDAEISARMQDWILLSDTLFDELGCWPVVGDEIDAGPVTFRVAPAGDSRCWRFSDGTRVGIRIHTTETLPDQE